MAGAPLNKTHQMQTNRTCGEINLHDIFAKNNLHKLKKKIKKFKKIDTPLNPSMLMKTQLGVCLCDGPHRQKMACLNQANASISVSQTMTLHHTHTTTAHLKLINARSIHLSQLHQLYKQFNSKNTKHEEDQFITEKMQDIVEATGSELLLQQLEIQIHQGPVGSRPV